MKNFYRILFITFLLVGNTSFSQVSVSISEVKLNGNSVSTVNLGTNTSGTVRFKVTVAKPSNLTVGSCLLTIGTYTSTGTYTSQITPQEIYYGSGTDGSTGIYEFELYDTDLDFAGGCYLRAKLEQIVSPNYPATPLLNWSSNQVPLKKTPTYTLTSNASSVQCGSTTPVVFTVSSNAPSNYSTYQWTYGSGWTLSGGTTGTTLTLIPNNTTPSTVSVSPIFSGEFQPAKSLTVTRSAIISSGSISGNTTVCTTRTYTFTGLLAGQTLNWSLSNTTAGTLNTTTGTSTIFTKTGGGAVVLTATVSNTCGQSYTKTVSLFAGSPPEFSLIRASNETCDDIKYHYVPFEIPNRNPLITYTFNVAPIPGVTVTQTSWTYNGNIQNVLVFPKTYVGPVDFIVSTTNSCGTFNYFAEEEINSCSGLGLRLNNPAKQFTVFPNPAKDIVTIESIDQENQKEKNTIISGELFDMMGQPKLKVQILENKAIFSVRELKKGIYILKIYINSQVEIHQVLVG